MTFTKEDARNKQTNLHTINFKYSEPCVTIQHDMHDKALEFSKSPKRILCVRMCIVLMRYGSRSFQHYKHDYNTFARVDQ